MSTSREFRRRAFRSALYEAQDVLVDIDDVELIRLEPTWGLRVRESWMRLPLYHDVSKRLMFLNPGLRNVRLMHEYDLFVAVCQNYWDLPYINAIHKWKDYCKTSVCWIDEMWAASIPGYKYWLHALSRFDHIFVGCRGSVAALSSAINRPCRWLPPAVDTLRFSPFPNPPARVIDVCSIGRRWDGIHRALLRAAASQKIFYIYDTLVGTANMNTYDHRQHRDHFANIAKRSRYFLVAPGKFDDSSDTRGQVEVGHRYYEGAASGTVMIGSRPDCEAFRELFHWPDAVIPIQPDGSDVIEVLASLGSEPARVSAISRTNAVQALLHHDWVYRWKEILRVAKVEPSPRMAAREQCLKKLSDLAANRRYSRSGPSNIE